MTLVMPEPDRNLIDRQAEIVATLRNIASGEIADAPRLRTDEPAGLAMEALACRERDFADALREGARLETVGAGRPS